MAPNIGRKTADPQLPRRKGARRMSEIPPEVLRGLNEGRLQTLTLVEWLAIDGAQLAEHVARGIGLRGSDSKALVARAQVLRSEGIVQRVKGMGAAVHALLDGHSRRDEVFEALATHPSDMARTWAAYSLGADPKPPLATRLRAVIRFARDPSMAVRECAWDTIRPHIARDLKRGLELLEPWARHKDDRVRRCAIEATRPRGVWCAHIEELKADPEPGLRLLEHVKADGSNTVRRSAGNWLNDASKSQPGWVRRVCARWVRESSDGGTAWIVHHALRTLRKKGEATFPGSQSGRLRQGSRK